MPYGSKSRAFIKKRVESIIDMLIKQYSVSCVIVACNTASSCVDITKYKNVYVMTFEKDITYLATPLTKKNLPHLNIIQDKDLAKQIETNLPYNKNKLNKIIKEHITALNLDKITSLCLGCTHYELVEKIFSKFMPNCQITKNSSKVVDNIKVEPSNELNIVFLSSKQTQSYINKLKEIALN